MSQRGYPPTSRDRSPSRQFDRRSSSTYTPGNSSSSYRPPVDAPLAVDRPPPRGPRADNFRGSFNSTPRGRGAPFAPRGGDSWDRDRDRDARTQPGNFRRDDDRPEWSRRDDRPPAFGRDRPNVGRERSASPLRSRRDSRENVGPPFNRPLDTGPGYFGGPPSRGGSDRGRGRGGWDRTRGRSSFIGDRERDLFPNRSRSREAPRGREFDRPRGFGAENERNDRFERRDFERQPDRDTRGRDHDVWARDPSPGRSSTGHRAPSPGSVSAISQDRKGDYDLSRKPLTSAISQSRDSRREGDSDYFSARKEGPRREPTFSQPSPALSLPQSSSLGLDYGPPPAAPVATPAVVAEKGPLPSNASKPDQPSSGPSSFQPPSGPKADRGSIPPSVGLSSSSSIQQIEARNKADGTIRQRPHHPEPAANQYEVSRTAADANNDRSALHNTQSERPLPSYIPSGPRLGPGTPYKPRTSPVAQQTSLPPVQPKSLNTDSRNIPNAPTGPRSASILPPSGPRSLPTGPAGIQGGSASASWRRPQVEFRSAQKPSIMANINRSHMSERPSSTNTHTSTKHSPQPYAFHPLALERFKADVAQSSNSQVRHPNEPYVQDDVEMSAQVSEEEDGDDEPESELDENYFADSERTHTREMELLKAKMPARLLEDPVVVRLLTRIQLLGMIAEGLVPDALYAVKAEKDVEMADHPSESIPSPQPTPEEAQSPRLEHPRPRGRPLKEPPVNPIPTPPLEALPFLLKEPPDFVIFDGLAEDEVEEEKVTTLLRTQFEKESWDEKDDIIELSEFYRQKFPEWRYEIDKYERQRRELEATPDPGSPGGQSAISIPPSAERLSVRAIRNATEFDIEKAILMSQQSAREEEERREREAASNARSNPETEADVPDMLKPAEREPAWRFQDTNSFVPTEYAVELMQYVPPEDDFTPDEQARFTTAFCQTPKKWGLIADAIPGRSYQECIAHYYLTKNEANYKEIWRRSQPKRKRGRAATKPRSTALLSDMALNEDLDATPTPVTDSGRPRRAAAPTFGDIPDAEAAALPAAKRLAIGPKESVEGLVTKPKVKKAGTATKTRRTKAQIMADQQAAQSQLNPDGTPTKGPSGRARTLIRADPLIAKADSGMSTMLTEPLNHFAQVPIRVAVVPARQEPPPVPVVTSYWSVPEQQKFRELVAYYGRDWQKIADFMKTKSQAMIKNHYQREVARNDEELRLKAEEADERLARGEPLGRLPSPVAPPKRKYDPMPPTNTQSRPTTAKLDAVNDIDRSIITQKVSMVDDFPANSIHRDVAGSMVAKPSPRNDLMHHSPLMLPEQTKLEEITRDKSVLPQKVGPTRGHFGEEPFYMHNQQRQQAVAADHIPHHHPARLIDLRGEQPVLQSRDLFGQSRDQYTQNHMQRYRGLETETSLHNRQGHSRNTSLIGHPTTMSEQHVIDVANDRNRLYGAGTTHSPRVPPIQASTAPRPEAFPAYATQQQQSMQQQQQQQQSFVKQEQPKPPPVKRSNLFDMLNNDEPPEKPTKRSSTDSVRPSIQTPPLQPVSTQNQPSYLRQDILGGRTGLYANAGQHQTQTALQDSRFPHSNSPAPSQRTDWLDKFDPRQIGIDRADNRSPLYSGLSPAPTPGNKTLLPNLGERSTDHHAPRRSNLARNQIASPPRQASTPVPQFRSTSAAPQQHSRMPSLGYAANQQLSADPRNAQLQPQSSQSQHIQPSVSHAQSATGTPVSSLHHRGHPSMDYAPGKRLTIQQELKAQGGLEQPRDPRELSDHRVQREDLLSRGLHESQHRQMGMPPHSQVHEQARQAPDHRDLYRNETISHQVPPPPPRVTHLSTGFGGGPPRSYNSTPPLANYGDPRMHNQHAHQHHQHISTQQPTQQQQQQQQQQGQVPPQGMHHQQQFHHHQQQMGMPQGLTHSHQLHPQQQQQPPPQQYREQQPRFGQPQPQPQSQGLAPPQGHYRNYSQGGDERR